MTLDVYRGRKTTKQHYTAILDVHSYDILQLGMNDFKLIIGLIDLLQTLSGPSTSFWVYWYQINTDAL